MTNGSRWLLYLSAEATKKHLAWLKAGEKGTGRIDLEGKNLTRAVSRGNDFKKARFVKCGLSDSLFSSCDFVEAEIIKCTWENTLIHTVDFDRALIEECSFINAYFGISHFIETKVKGGDWSRTDLDKSTWTKAKVNNVCFQRTNLWRSKLQEAHFVSCDFRDANLMSVKGDNAVFENCDFRGAYLRSFRFKNTTFKNCAFHGCIGNPKLEGNCILIEPDVSVAFDGTGIVESEKLLEKWKSNSSKSQPEVAISVSNPPQWLSHISREDRATHVEWISRGMTGIGQINLNGKNLTRSFAYSACLRAARFANCDFTDADLRRSQVEQAEFVGCRFDKALLMYLEAVQGLHLNVKTSQTLFRDCQANGAYLNRSQLEKPQFIGGNWRDSFFNNCVWTLAMVENICFQNTSWRGAKLDTVSFVNCDFRNANFDEAEITAAKFINCDFRGVNFGNANGTSVRMERCGFYGAKGLFYDINTKNYPNIVAADLSLGFDGSSITESLDRIQDLFPKLKKD